MAIYGPTHRSGLIGTAFIYALLSATALFLGLLINFIGYEVAVVLVLILVASLASLKYPVLPAFMALLVVVDAIPFPKGGRLYPVFIVAMILTTITVSYLRGARVRIVNWKPFLPVFLISAAMIAGYIHGTLYRHNSSVYALGEFQCVLAWLFCPALIIGLKEDRRSTMLLRLLLSIGIVISVVTIVQYLTGLSFGARVEQLETLGSVDTSVTRATIPAKLFVLFSLFTIVGWISGQKVSFVRLTILLPLVAVVSFALLISFGRALWASALVGLILTSLLLGKRHFFVITSTVIALGFVGAIVLQTFDPAVANAVTERALSVFQEGASNSSFGWRVGENMFAERAISRNPLFGIGLGGEYKPPLVSSLLFPNQTSYIHNSYYYFALKLGIPSIIFPAFLVISFTYFGLALLRKMPDSVERCAVAAGISSTWALAALGVTQPEWISVSSVAFLTCFLALISQLNVTIKTV